MHIIDRMLYKKGFTLQHEGNFSAGYLRKIYSSDGKDTGIAHAVLFDGSDGGIIFESRTQGGYCEFGESCSYPVSFDELRLFMLKGQFLRVKWALKRAYYRLKRRIFGDGQS